MNKIGIIIISILFFVNRNKVLLAGIRAIDVWSKTLFPLLFPTFILNDLIISSGIMDMISKILGRIYEMIFHQPKEGVNIFLLSMISGTPSNAKNIKNLLDNGYIKESDATKLLFNSYFFNPFFIIAFTSIKVLIIMYVSNIIASIILRDKHMDNHDINTIRHPKFNLSLSITNNIDILLNILGTITIFFVISSLIPINNVFIKTLISGILELTSGLSLLSVIKIPILYKLLISIIISFGGLSIFFQVKSILKDTFIDINYMLKNRFLCSVIMFILLML